MSALAFPILVLMLVWLVYTITTYALPCLAGLIVARYAFETGAGWLGACAIFGATALLVFGLMRWLFAVVTNPLARIVLAIAFVMPAGVMSYVILGELSVGHVPSELWRQALCVTGAGMSGLMAFGRLAAPNKA